MARSRVDLLIAALVVHSSVAAVQSESFGPETKSARDNAPAIFNAVHNAMREFGSALHHNGMSLFPAEVSEGVRLYHGTTSQRTPSGPEWLAFEVEHAQSFAHPPPSMGPSGDGGKGPPPLTPREKSLEHTFALRHAGRSLPPERNDPKKPAHGYLHIYETTRPVRVLYIDGTSAGKTVMGTLDTQDYLLTGKPNRSLFEEWERASDLCRLARMWDMDGFIRMEPGFEIVQCNFTRGLKLVSVLQQPDAESSGPMKEQDMEAFEWLRAASQRYHGIGAARVRLDYSSMVSAFFYPVNLSNQDAARPELPRLQQATSTELDSMRLHVANATIRSFAKVQDVVDWQGITDMIVSRYADRLQSLAEAESVNVFKSVLDSLLNVYIDYSEDDVDIDKALERCMSHYLARIKVQTLEDRLLFEAFKGTTSLICSALFEARQCVVAKDFHSNQHALACGHITAQNLITCLAWSKWKECGRCQSNEVCMVAMWPFGSVEDHYHPSCINYTALRGRHGYWRTKYSPPHGGEDETKSLPGEIGEL